MTKYVAHEIALETAPKARSAFAAARRGAVRAGHPPAKRAGAAGRRRRRHGLRSGRALRRQRAYGAAIPRGGARLGRAAVRAGGPSPQALAADAGGAPRVAA